MAEMLVYLPYAAAIAFAGYLAFMAALIAWRTAFRLWYVVKHVSSIAAYKAAIAVSDFVIEVVGIGLFYTGKAIARWFRPVADVLDRGRKAREAANLLKATDPIQEAKDILGLPNRFSQADLRSRWIELMKRVAPDAGGTDWLAARVNAAHDLLKGVAI